MQPHHIHKYEDIDGYDSPPDIPPPQYKTDHIQSPDIKKGNTKLRYTFPCHHIKVFTMLLVY